MASLEQVEKQVRSLSVAEIEQLEKSMKAIRKEAEAKEGQERGEKIRKEIGIDDKVQFRRAGKTFLGVVETIQRDGVRVRIEGGKRARVIRWHEVLGKK